MAEFLKAKWYEFEKIADFKIEELDRIKKMPVHDYLLHILALKKRSDEAQHPDTEEDF